ncbi:helix-turn-helix domain-containing protein [Rubeoparvulum massiliense]|uniref:helix-turn-helix domain-containing protein n=1 Tax=Rubeoparvulum massiliense TaxID=1631346 RepID=UPI00065E78D2|nr:helix-turn-helix transcriptional regulator [Rubeoparvulum massiliense]
MNIADRIQSLRKTRGISQEQLADELGVSRQAVSKWESEQSMPDIEKIIMMSNYFEVTTDYLLKGIEPQTDAMQKKASAAIFSAVGTAFNFIGLVVAIMIWEDKQTPTAVAVGFILMAIGCMIFVIGQIIGEKDSKKSSLKYFSLINTWILLLMPISWIFNFVDGTVGGFSWTFTPLPQLGNSYISYGLCWLIYFILCVAINFYIIVISRKETR